MYTIQQFHPMPVYEEKERKGDKFPFNSLSLGEGFFVPNKENLPEGEYTAEPQSFRNMQNHCNSRNKRIKNKAEQKVFRCRLFPTDPRWIQVWRES